MKFEPIYEDGIITLNGEELPGLLRSLSVDGKVRFDEQKVDGASGKKKTPQGFEDCDISVSLYLLNEDCDISVSLYLLNDDESSCYDKLSQLNEMFRKTDAKANPQIYEISNHHISFRGIRKVVFSKLSTSENDKTDEIVATLGFVEHTPPIVKMEKAQAKTPGPKELAKKAIEKVTGSDDKKQTESPKEDALIIELD